MKSFLNNSKNSYSLICVLTVIIIYLVAPFVTLSIKMLNVLLPTVLIFWKQRPHLFIHLTLQPREPGIIGSQFMLISEMILLIIPIFYILVGQSSHLVYTFFSISYYFKSLFYSNYCVKLISTMWSYFTLQWILPDTPKYACISILLNGQFTLLQYKFFKLFCPI